MRRYDGRRVGWLGAGAFGGVDPVPPDAGDGELLHENAGDYLLWGDAGDYLLWN